MERNISFLTTLLLTLTLGIAVAPLTGAVERTSRSRTPHHLKKKLQLLEDRLTKKHGADAWYVFRVDGFKPQVERELELRHRGHRAHAQQHIRIRASSTTRVFKVRGSRMAAAQIWQAARSPLVKRYEYRAFKDKERAEELFELIRDTVRE